MLKIAEYLLGLICKHKKANSGTPKEEYRKKPLPFPMEIAEGVEAISKGNLSKRAREEEAEGKSLVLRNACGMVFVPEDCEIVKKSSD